MPSADWKYIDNCSGCKKEVDIQYIEIEKPNSEKDFEIFLQLPANSFIGKPYCSAECVKKYSDKSNKVVSI